MSLNFDHGQTKQNVSLDPGSRLVNHLCALALATITHPDHITTNAGVLARLARLGSLEVSTGLDALMMPSPQKTS